MLARWHKAIHLTAAKAGRGLATAAGKLPEAAGVVELDSIYATIRTADM